MTKIRKKTHEQRTHIICLRLTDLELSILDEKAEKCRMTRSDFIRSLILSRKLMPKYEIVIDSKEIQALLLCFHFSDPPFLVLTTTDVF